MDDRYTTPQRIAEHAKQFYNAHLIIYEYTTRIGEELRRLYPGKGWDSPEAKAKAESGEWLFAATAEIVNLSFAAELYLKAVIRASTGKYASGHDQKKLFEKLDKSVQDDLRERCRMIEGETITDRQFDRWLEGNKLSFVEFRYLYEIGITNIEGFWWHLAVALVAACQAWLKENGFD